MLSVLLTIIIVPFRYLEIQKMKLEKLVEEYLIDEKGYSFQE
ncbi:hypothetical protein [Solibacillus sp. R5-41]|nr:hypothetical protein [Solibacillus sp. R5-41]